MNKKQTELSNKYKSITIPANLKLSDSFKYFDKQVALKDHDNADLIDLNVKMSANQVTEFLKKFGFVPCPDTQNLYIYREKNVQLTIKAGQTLQQLIRLMLHSMYISGYYE